MPCTLSQGRCAFLQMDGNAGHQPLPCSLPISGIHCPTRHTRRIRPTCSLQVAKLHALPSAFHAAFKARSPCTGARMRPRGTGETVICRPVGVGADWRYRSNFSSPPITSTLVFDGGDKHTLYQEGRMHFATSCTCSGAICGQVRRCAVGERRSPHV